MTDYARDLWWEARQKTALMSQPAAAAALFKTISRSLPGAPTKAVSIAAATLGRDKAGLIIDLNKYRAGKNLKEYVEVHGVDGFILRLGGPNRWVAGNWEYTEDPTYRPYLEEIDRLGMREKTVGYIIHNAFENWQTDYQYNTHVDLVNQWTSGGYMPAALNVDHEVATCWMNGKETTITAYNLVKSLEAALTGLYKKFRKPVSVYTARWFMDKYGKTEHETFFDNINKPESLGGPGKQYPLWAAWYPQSFKPLARMEDALQSLLVPTGDQRGKFLAIGSYTVADLWQFTSNLNGVDANVTMGSLDDYWKAFGLNAATIPTPEPDPDPDPVPSEELEALKARIATLEQFMAYVKAA